ncbi:hypothetical protein C2G38_2032475 [Gigaspora rosea]|uniref:Uncharacterized protein n=1 Tax=Gigaspora rosea TaxID=44941 RepID=A0A397VQZ5_9GLOM|nr:hypothetical protein C2G38_2032475 [Gigaspora rosea]
MRVEREGCSLKGWKMRVKWGGARRAGLDICKFDTSEEKGKGKIVCITQGNRPCLFSSSFSVRTQMRDIFCPWKNSIYHIMIAKSVIFTRVFFLTGFHFSD